MMKKLIAVFSMVLASCMLFTGCMPSKEISVAVNPDFVQSDSIKIDFIELHNNVINDLMSIEDGEPFVFIMDIDISGDTNAKTVSVSALANKDTTEEDAKSFATTILRMIGDEAAVQDIRYEASSPEYFGDFYNEYSVNLQVVNEDKAGVIYELAVPAGEQIPLSPDYESYIDSWLKEKELFYENAVYDKNGNIVY